MTNCTIGSIRQFYSPLPIFFRGERGESKEFFSRLSATANPIKHQGFSKIIKKIELIIDESNSIYTTGKKA